MIMKFSLPIKKLILVLFTNFMYLEKIPEKSAYHANFESTSNTSFCLKMLISRTIFELKK